MSHAQYSVPAGNLEGPRSPHQVSLVNEQNTKILNVALSVNHAVPVSVTFMGDEVVMLSVKSVANSVLKLMQTVEFMLSGTSRDLIRLSSNSENMKKI